MTLEFISSSNQFCKSSIFNMLIVVAYVFFLGPLIYYGSKVCLCQSFISFPYF